MFHLYHELTKQHHSPPRFHPTNFTDIASYVVLCRKRFWNKYKRFIYINLWRIFFLMSNHVYVTELVWPILKKVCVARLHEFLKETLDPYPKWILQSGNMCCKSQWKHIHYCSVWDSDQWHWQTTSGRACPFIK